MDAHRLTFRLSYDQWRAVHAVCHRLQLVTKRKFDGTIRECVCILFPFKNNVQCVLPPRVPVRALLLPGVMHQATRAIFEMLNGNFSLAREALNK
jgi:hypothetical protein